MNGIRSFELLEDLSPGGSAKAILLKWNGSRYVHSREKVTVYDYVQSHGDSGDRGFAFLSDESGLWHVLSGLYQQASSQFGL